MTSIHADPPPPIVTEPGGINYATGSALGKGGFAICHRAERYDGSRPTGHMVALKIVKTKMEPAKLAQKVQTNCVPSTISTSKANTVPVRHRTSNPLETGAYQHRWILSRLLLPDKYICRAGTVLEWLARGYAEEETILDPP